MLKKIWRTFLYWNISEDRQHYVRNLLIRIAFYALACMIFLYISSEREAYILKDQLKQAIVENTQYKEENNQWITNYYELSRQANHLGKQIHELRRRHEAQIDEIREASVDNKQNVTVVKEELHKATDKLKFLEAEVGLTKKQIKALESLDKKNK